MTGNMGTLWFNNKEKKYFFVVNYKAQVGCNKCDEKIDLKDSVMFQRQYWPKPVELIFCDKCVEKSKDFFADEHMIVTITDRTPLNSHIVPFESLKTVIISKGTVWDVAMRHDDGATVNDRTVHALRENWEGSNVGLPDKGRIRELDKPIKSVKEAGKVLDGLFSAQPVLPEPDKDKQKQIG